MGILTFRLEDEIKLRLDAVVVQLGLNQSQVLRDAIIERLEELAILMERVKAKRKKRPLNELWKELGLADDVR